MTDSKEISHPSALGPDPQSSSLSPQNYAPDHQSAAPSNQNCVLNSQSSVLSPQHCVPDAQSSVLSTHPSAMRKDARILVVGASGMVGSAIIRKLLSLGYTNILGTYHSHMPDINIFLQDDNPADLPKALKLVKLDLTVQEAVNGFFYEEKPATVFLAAARVGGIHANNTYPAQFLYENLAIQSNTIHAAYQTGVDRLLFLGSSCERSAGPGAPPASAHDDAAESTEVIALQVATD